jgi:hypothetical protein
MQITNSKTPSGCNKQDGVFFNPNSELDLVMARELCSTGEAKLKMQ